MSGAYQSDQEICRSFVTRSTAVPIATPISWSSPAIPSCRKPTTSPSTSRSEDLNLRPLGPTGEFSYGWIRCAIAGVSFVSITEVVSPAPSVPSACVTDASTLIFLPAAIIRATPRVSRTAI